MRSAKPGSITGDLPALIIATLSGLTSTPITSWPAFARHAAVTDPTYPRPKMLMRIRKILLLPVSVRIVCSAGLDRPAPRRRNRAAEIGPDIFMVNARILIRATGSEAIVAPGEVIETDVAQRRREKVSGRIVGRLGTYDSVSNK